MTKSGSTVPASYLEFKEQVAELRYKKGKKQTEIAQELGFPSKHAVSQILQAHEAIGHSNVYYGNSLIICIVVTSLDSKL